MRLSMIEYIGSLFEESALEDYYIIGIQHILPSTYVMFTELFKKGLKKQNLSLLGKCYSTDHDTFQKMKNDAIDVCDSSLYFNSHEKYDVTTKRNIKNFINKRKHIFNSSKFKKIIILDDGGKLLKELKKLNINCDNIIAMEQTSSGFNLLKNKEIDFPIINLARARSKLNIETKRVVQNGIRKIFNEIYKLNLQIKKIIIIGNGEIGSFLFECLKDTFETKKYDKYLKKSDFTNEEFLIALSETDLIIGCSGNVSIKNSWHKYLKQKTVLVSLSSSDREFDAIHLRKHSPFTNNPWQVLLCNGVYLLNSGFPISFDNDNADDSLFFQFTRSLIMASIYQALKMINCKKGFVDLDENLQNKIEKKFEEYSTFNQDFKNQENSIIKNKSFFND